jgi:hypothetical protein
MAVLGQKTGMDGLPRILFAKSDSNWTPTVTFEAYVWVFGGGGSGAAVGGTSDYSATGGGAGATAVSRIMLNASSQYVVTIGNGGAIRTATGNGVAGAAGSNSSFVCSAESLSITANGGAAGATASGASASGGAGGAAGSTGNLANYAGGAAMDASATDKATGGGAVGLWDTGNPGIVEGTNDDNDGNTDYGENAVADGGSPFGSQGGGTYGETDLQYTYLTSVGGIPIAMSPFSDLFSMTNNKNTGYATSSKWASEPTYYPSGAQLFTYWGDGYRRDTEYKTMQPASPFLGGNGINTNEPARTYTHSGDATLGGGGGACINLGSGHYAYSGRGGKGAVLIFPISMG